MKETNESYRLATVKSDNSIPISIYFIKTDSFMGLNELKAEKLGIKSTCQIKPIKIIYKFIIMMKLIFFYRYLFVLNL